MNKIHKILIEIEKDNNIEKYIKNFLINNYFKNNIDNKKEVEYIDKIKNIIKENTNKENIKIINNIEYDKLKNNELYLFYSYNDKYSMFVRVLKKINITDKMFILIDFGRQYFIDFADGNYISEDVYINRRTILDFELFVKEDINEVLAFNDRILLFIDVALKKEELINKLKNDYKLDNNILIRKIINIYNNNENEDINKKIMNIMEKMLCC